MLLRLTPLFGKGTLHEEKMPAWCIHEHDTLHKPSDYVKHRRNISCTRDDGTTGIRSTPGKADNGHRHQRNNSARDSGLNFALQRNSKTASNTALPLPHIHTPSPVVSKPA